MKTQAWGWLTAAVLAAGLNASYHDGGLTWAHRIADQVGHNLSAVAALASGNAQEFLIEARQIATDNETPSCRFDHAVAHVETKVAESQAQFDRFEAMSAREQARFARLEANRARMQAKLAENASRFHFSMVDFNPADFATIETPRCPHLRVNVPRIPAIKIPSPSIHVEISGPGPV